MSGRFSWWERNHFLDEIDVTILGAGLVGLSTAIELKLMSPDLEILVLDKKTIPIGASTKNAGFACFGSVSEILDDIDQFGEEICHKLVAMRARGLSLLRSRVSSSKMNLELIARNLGVKFIQGVEVENINFEDKKLKTGFGAFSYKKLVVCTNGFSFSLLPEKNVQPARNQVLVTNSIDGFTLNGCYHMNKGYVYFREVNGRLILGGGRHINKSGETTDKLENTDEILDYLERIAKDKILNNFDFKIEHVWSGILGVGDEKMPLVESINEDVIIAIRMGGMGVAVGSYIGRVAASILLDNDNSDRDLFVRR